MIQINMTKQIIEEIEQLFNTKLNEQNSWGKEQVKVLYKSCVVEVLLNHIVDK